MDVEGPSAVDLLGAPVRARCADTRVRHLIDRLVDAFGSQCVVIGIDSIGSEGEWTTRQMTGNPDQMQATGRRTLEWIEEVTARGAGEIVLNCMNQDGVRRGYDIPQLQQVREACTVPLIASGGAGTMAHFAAVFHEARVDGALAASVFHTAAINIQDLKHYLREQRVEIRE